MTAITDFLNIVNGRTVFCCTWFADNGNRVGMHGKVVAHDDRHVVIQGEKTMHLFRVEDIIEIEFDPRNVEVVAPEKIS